jgi:hypothetical protein
LTVSFRTKLHPVGAIGTLVPVGSYTTIWASNTSPTWVLGFCTKVMAVTAEPDWKAVPFPTKVIGEDGVGVAVGVVVGVSVLVAVGVDVAVVVAIVKVIVGVGVAVAVVVGVGVAVAVGVGVGVGVCDAELVGVGVMVAVASVNSKAPISQAGSS